MHIQASLDDFNEDDERKKHYILHPFRAVYPRGFVITVSISQESNTQIELTY